jgi:predicted TIM-barrel fold metal-dependent hydrolase
MALGASAAAGQTVPRADHHQHLFSPEVAKAESVQPVDARDLVAMLDAAGIRRAAVLSVAYLLGDPKGTAEGEYQKVKAENDWTSRQVARYPERLVGFCSVNPLKPYAVEELARCARDPLVDGALSVLVDAIVEGDPRTRHLYFDVTTVVLPVTSAERLALISTRVRQLGLQRILYGSDAASGGNLPPGQGWAAFRRLPLTEAEFHVIADNVPPYLR